MMHTIRRTLRFLLCCTLCVVLLLPSRVGAADLYFTSVNDNLLPLTTSTMPIWSGGDLYVPYTVFDTNSTGINLGLYCSYSKGTNILTLYNVLNIKQILTFDLHEGTTRDELTGESFPARAILRNGRPFVPISTVCNYFGLDYSYNALSAINQGYLVRVKSSSVGLSDSKFIDAAGDLINRRLREYNQSLAPAVDQNPVTPPVAPPAVDEIPVSPSDIRTYLAFRCTDTAGVAAILTALENSGVYALFLFPPQVLEQADPILRRISATGHSIGIWADGADVAQTRAMLLRGQHALEEQLFLRTTIAEVPSAQRQGLGRDGWQCWRESFAFSPSATVSASGFAASTLRRLNGRTATTYITLTGNVNTARILPTLLRQLANNQFVVSIPLETKL